MRFFAIIMVLILMLGVVGCAKPEGTPVESATDKNTPESSSINVTENNNQSSEPEKEVVYDNWEKVTGKSIYVNYRNDRRKDENYSSSVFHSNHTDMVALTYNTDGAFTGNLKDVFDYLNTGDVVRDVASHAEANFYDLDKTYIIEPVSMEPVTIGDLDTIQITGNVVDANGRKCHVYGYTFIYDDTPCFLVGFVFTEEQEQSMIESINNEVDAMIKTVRSEL